MLGNEYTKNEIEKRIKSASSEHEHYNDLSIEGIVRELSDFSFLPKESFREYFDKSLQELTDKINGMVDKVSKNETFPLTEDYVKGLSGNTVKSWFNTGETRNPSSRADLFKLGFALGLDEGSFKDFCQKVFRQKHCVNNPVEFCMIYCLKNNRNYADALDLYAKAKKISDQADSQEKNPNAEGSSSTVIVLNDMPKKEKDFLEYLAENMSRMTPSLDRINERFEEIFENCFSSEDSVWTLYNKVIKENEFYDLTHEYTRKPKKFTSGAFESYFFPKTDVLKDGNQENKNQEYENQYRQLAFAGRDDKNIGKNIKDTKITHKDYQKARKKLITAHFIWYYVCLFYKNMKNEIISRNKKQNSEDYYLDYRQQIDNILESLNLAPMYFLDPFDRLFMICAARENPIIDYYKTLKTIAFPPTE